MVTEEEGTDGVCPVDRGDLRVVPPHTWLSSGTQGTANGQMAPAAASPGPKWTAVETG